jgi:hypothetical protein
VKKCCSFNVSRCFLDIVYKKRADRGVGVMQVTYHRLLHFPESSARQLNEKMN